MTTPTQTLPALPEAAAWMTNESAARLGNGGNCKGTVPVHQNKSAVARNPVFTGFQMHEFGNRQFNAGREFERERLAPQPAPAPDAVPRIDPMQDPMRPGYCMNYAADETPAEMVLRKLACWLGVGGYNAPKVDAEIFHRKIVDGVQMLLAGAAPVAKVAEPLPRGRRTRAEFVKLARVIAEGCGRQDDAPSYLPRTPEAAATFEPHGWVVLALMQAHADGYDDGHSDGMALVKAAHPQHPAPQPLTDEQIEKLREDTFSTNNPFCPCDRKTMRKAVRAAERAHGISAAQVAPAAEDPIASAWQAGRSVQYLVRGGHDDEWTDYFGACPPDTASKRLAWRVKPAPTTGEG